MASATSSTQFNLLLVSATQAEIAPFLQTGPSLPPGIQLTVLISGVGIAASMYHLSRQLSHHHYHLVLQAGVGGAFGTQQSLQLGEVVLVHQDAFGDLGAYEQQRFTSPQEMGLSHEQEWLHNNHPLLNQLPYKKASAITVNTITDDSTIINALQQRWSPDIETMEGAVLHYACLQQQLPFLQLRAISNAVGVRDKSLWKLKESIENLNQAIAKVIQQIAKSNQ